MGQKHVHSKRHMPAGATDEQEDAAAHNDTEVAHAVAASLNVDIAVIEATIMEHDGNIELAMEVWLPVRLYRDVPIRASWSTHAGQNCIAGMHCSR